MILEVVELTASYGRKEVLAGVNVTLPVNCVLALLGHNGAGKSTLLKTIFGLVPKWHGEIRIVIDGERIPLHPRELIRAGIVYVPQGNRVFGNLSVRQNLSISSTLNSPYPRMRQDIDLALVAFPELKPLLSKMAGTLSGGEKQMTALGRALVLSPRLLLLDEPSLGLAPLLVSRTLGILKEYCTETVASAVIVEHRVRETLKVSDRVCILRNGTVTLDELVENLSEDDLKSAYF